MTSPSSPRVNRTDILLVFIIFVVENFAFFVVLDGLTHFLRRYFQHVLCIVDDKRASLHENQGVVESDLLRPLLNKYASFCSSKASASYCLICSSVQPSSDNDLRYLSSLYHLSRTVWHEPFFWKFGFSQHITCLVTHCLTH